MKTSSYRLVTAILLCASSIRAQQKSHLFVDEQTPTFRFANEDPLRIPMKPFQVKIPCKRNGVAFQFRGSYKSRKEYSPFTGFTKVKSFSLRIHPFRIHVKPKQKSL